MKEKTKFSKKLLKISVISLVAVFLYFSYQCLYMNGQAKDIKSIQDYAKISKTAHLLNDKKTLDLIVQAKKDDRITRAELEDLKQSSMEFKREVSKEIKPAEQREKEFMERKAKFLNETQKTISNE